MKNLLSHRDLELLIPSPLHIAKSFPMPEFYSGATGQPGHFSEGFCLRRLQKGRRERVLPLWRETAFAIEAWLKARPTAGAAELFLNPAGRAMTRSGFEYILAKHVAVAAQCQVPITSKRVTPHVLRHICAMHT